MTNKKHSPKSIVAKPPVDTNKPKFTKRAETVSYSYTDKWGDTITLSFEGAYLTFGCTVYVEDIPTLIAVLQDIYSGANV